MTDGMVAGDSAAFEAMIADHGRPADLTTEEQAFLLHHASSNANGKMVEALLDAGFDVNMFDSRGYTPLMSALEAGNSETANLLKMRGADLSSTAPDGNTAEYFAQILGLDGFEMPEQTKVHPLEPAEANLALLLAAELGDADSVRFALESGADPEIRASNKWSPLMLASLGSHREALEVIVASLKSKGEDVARQDIARSLAETGLDPVVVALTGRGGAAPDIERAQRTVAYLLAKVVASPAVDTLMEYQNTAFRLGYPSLLPSRFSSGTVQGPSIDGQVPASGSHAASETEPNLSLEPLPADTAPAPATPPNFLPPLEYGLPISGESNEAGWRDVQRFLYDEGRLYTGTVTGRLDDDTYMALLAYLEPLMPILEARTREAELRADEEGTLARATQNPFRYGTSPGGDGSRQYRGELRFLPDGKAVPSGYVSYRSDSAEYFAPGGETDQSLCLFSRNEAASNLRILDCRLLDGRISIGDNDSFVVIGFRRGNEIFEHLLIDK